jgi:hypothetical protein
MPEAPEVPSKPESKSKVGSDLQTKDKIGLTLSCLALIMSLFAFITNVRVVDEASVRLMDALMYYPDDPGAKVSEPEIVVHAIFSNTGNRPLILAEGRYAIGVDQDQAKSHSIGGDELRSYPNLFPLLLPAHELRLVDLAVPVEHLLSLFQHAKALPTLRTGKKEQCRRLYVDFRFTTFDSQGEMHKVYTNSVFSVDLTKYHISILDTLSKAEQRPPLSLI